MFYVIIFKIDSSYKITEFNNSLFQYGLINETT